MKKKLIILSGIVIPLICIVFGYRYYAYYPLQKIHPKGEEIVGHSISPDNQHKVKLYRSSGGSTVPWTLRGVVYSNKSNENRVIYWNEGEKAGLSWKDNSTVIINGKEIDVDKGSYDYRYDN